MEIVFYEFLINIPFFYRLGFILIVVVEKGEQETVEVEL